MYTLKCPPETNTVGSLNLPFSFHFNGHFPGVPALAGTKMSPVWILSKLRMMEVVVTMELQQVQSCRRIVTKTN